VLFGPERFGQGAQDLRQEGDSRLPRSAGAGGEAGEADLFSRHRRSFCAVGIEATYPGAMSELYIGHYRSDRTARRGDAFRSTTLTRAGARD
jgi:hypothetical protein